MKVGYYTNYSDGWRYSPAITVLPVTWQATIKPYKHQITHLGRVDVVIFAENFFFENSGVKRGKNPSGAPRPTLPTRHAGRPKQKEHTPDPTLHSTPLVTRLLQKKKPKVKK